MNTEAQVRMTIAINLAMIGPPALMNLAIAMKVAYTAKVDPTVHHCCALTNNRASLALL